MGPRYEFVIICANRVFISTLPWLICVVIVFNLNNVCGLGYFEVETLIVNIYIYIYIWEEGDRVWG